MNLQTRALTNGTKALPCLPYTHHLGTELEATPVLICVYKHVMQIDVRYKPFMYAYVFNQVFEICVGIHSCLFGDAGAERKIWLMRNANNLI